MKHQLVVENTSKEELLSEIGSLIDSKVADISARPTLEEEKQSPGKFFSLVQAASILKMHKNTLVKKCKNGKISFQKEGRYRFTEEDLTNYLKRHRNERS